MIRSSAWLALLACSVARQRWPVSAKLDGVAHGLGRSHLTDEDDVRSLAQGIFQGGLEGVRVHPHLALRDNAALVLVDEFDGILHRDDVPPAVAVTVADHCRQGSGLTRAGPTYEDNQAALGHGQLTDNIRQVQILQFRDLRLDPAQHHAAEVALEKGADTETPDSPGH
jgi:hypothetical protein